MSGLECSTLNFIKDYLVALSEYIKGNILFFENIHAKFNLIISNIFIVKHKFLNIM